jgi:hypothetical protein
MANRKHVALLKQGGTAWNAPSCRRRLTSAGRTSVERTYSGFWRQRPGRRPTKIAGYAPSFTGTTRFDRPGRLRRDCMSFGILIFGKKNVGYIPSVKYGHTP